MRQGLLRNQAGSSYDIRLRLTLLVLQLLVELAQLCELLIGRNRGMRVLLRRQLLLVLERKLAVDLAQCFSRQPPYHRTLIFYHDPFEERRRFLISNLAEREYRSGASALVFGLRHKLHNSRCSSPVADTAELRNQMKSSDLLRRSQKQHRRHRRYCLISLARTQQVDGLKLHAQIRVGYRFDENSVHFWILQIA